jgi:opacity protein-like surface antigen
MKRVLLAGAALLIAFSSIAVFAADVTGTWSAEMKGPNGDGFQLTFTFKQDGSKLTGTVLGPQGDPIDITDGKVDGDKLSFNVSFNGMTIKHQGVISGDEIKMTSQSDQRDLPAGEMILKRSK